MSNAKSQKKAAAGGQKAEIKKSETGAKTASEAPKSAETKTAEKTSAAPKSASQSSISHFSSVSTPAYREGWENIFGGSNNRRTKPSNANKSEDLPDKLTIEDADIDEELKAALYKAFQRQARAQGISLARLKKQVDFDYILECNLRKK